MQHIDLSSVVGICKDTDEEAGFLFQNPGEMRNLQITMPEMRSGGGTEVRTPDSPCQDGAQRCGHEALSIRMGH